MFIIIILMIFFSVRNIPEHKTLDKRRDLHLSEKDCAEDGNCSSTRAATFLHSPTAYRQLIVIYLMNRFPVPRTK